MEVTFAKRMDSFQEGIFTVLNKKKNELLAQGRTIYNLSVGTPDFKPAPQVMQALTESASKPENYKYSLVERPALLEAMQNFYNRRFGVQLDTKQIMAVNGSQEAMTHICWALCDPGDVVLVPNPGYPIFEVGPFLCGAEIVKYPLYEENGFLPKFSDIPEETAKKAKVMVVSYPANPVCATANDAFYEELIAFAKKYNIIIIHDNAYADIIYDGEGQSFLKYDGASEVGVEYYSLSKTFDLTGARVSFVLGNEAIIQKFRTLRSQIDYGIFYPVQDAAIAALNGPFDGVERQQEEYAARNRALCGGLRSIGWNVPDSHGSMFVWAPLPTGYTDSMAFCLELIDKAGVICTPGFSFGPSGEGYVRFALTLPVERIREAVASIAASGMIR